jgi:hypothetical protein
VHEWGGWNRVLERSDECFGGFNCDSGWCGEWHFEFLWKEFDSIGDPLGSGLVDENAVTAIMFGHWFKYQPSTPCGSHVRRWREVGFFVHYYLDSWWCQGRSIVVECVIDYLVCRHGWITSCRSE